MAETSAIPVVVLSRQQDPVELINSTLRNAGQAVHCQWVRDLSDLPEALGQPNPPQLAFLCIADAAELDAAMAQRAQVASHVPVIVVREALSEADLVRAVELGAADVVTLHARPRLQAVAARVLDTTRLDRALNGTLASAREYRDQMRAFMTGSTDAIAHVQEGIVVDVNPAWSELLGRAEPGELLGQPLMDFFDPRTHSALKGALVAAAQGRWTGHALQASAVLPDNALLPLELTLERFEFEGEPAVRLRVASQKRDLETLAQQLEATLRQDSRTGLLRRPAFIETAGARAAQPLKAGLRSIAYLAPDNYAELEQSTGPVEAEEVLEALGRCLHDHLQPGDIASRVSANGFAVVFERGNARDQEAWLGRLLERIAGTEWPAGAGTTKLTCSAGWAPLSSQGEPLRQPLELAVQACRAATAGGNRSVYREPAGTKGPVDAADRAWATQIKAALMANRFRLVQQPIASLVGDDQRMFDLVVRMLDEAGQEVLPSEFIAAAERTDLMKNIDRWIVGAAMSFCAARQPHRVFVRLSKDSMHDQTLGGWLQQQLKASGVEPGRVVIELTEELVNDHPREARTLLGLLSALGIEFAIEHFGASGQDAAALLRRLPVNYVKIDGALMQGLANDRSLQEKVKALADAAREHNIKTIAERVEDANTMAVLWQLGVEFIQGYFVEAPEQVTIG